MLTPEDRTAYGCDKDKIAPLYQSGLNALQVADELRSNETTVLNHLRQLGIPRRKSGMGGLPKWRQKEIQSKGGRGNRCTKIE